MDNLERRVLERKSYVDNDIQRTDLDLLARICYALDCNLNEIMEYKK
ncbi:MAG: helix-turn-helix domain-containing protein [Clostridia bacterium]|nr:helix-turn-helix domain-containing protein [Clostridia bacterium]